MRWNYAYHYFNENTGRVVYAQNLNDATLDRSYDYDHVGRPTHFTSGSNARHHTGQGGTPLNDGPSSHGYGFDVWGNRTYFEGWGGIGGSGRIDTASYTNNRRNGFSYDPAGNEGSKPHRLVLLLASSSKSSVFRCRRRIMSRFLLSIIFLACCLPIVAHGKTWRGIVPLRSTRADVERLLGPGNRGHYQFDKERAHVNYAEGECNTVNGCLCLVPKDTVISIYVQLEVEMSFSKLNIDKKNYEKFVSRKDPNVATYSNDKEESFTP